MARQDPPRPKSLPRRLVGFLVEVVVILVLASVISTVIRSFVVEQYHVPTGSMELTIQVDDRIAVSKLSDIERGAVVVFADDLGWDATTTPDTRPAWRKAVEFVGFLPRSTEDYLVKRVVGLPGDHVTCCTAAGQLEVNGVAVDEPYLYSASGATEASLNPFDVVVPEGRIFVLGDHRDGSADSRWHLCTNGVATPNQAFPALESVRGPVIAVIWPKAHWSKTPVNQALADIPAAASAPADPVVTLPATC
jgi:signal peptidase I